MQGKGERHTDARHAPSLFETFHQIISMMADIHAIVVLIHKLFLLLERVPVSTCARLNLQKTALTRRNLMTRDNHQCQYCLKHLSSRHVTLDHVLPRSRGGRNNWENLVICCLACNLKKANRLPAEAGMKLAKTPVEPNHQMPLPYLRNPNTPLPREWEPFLASLPYPVSFA